jgi:hypothetical protein
MLFLEGDAPFLHREGAAFDNTAKCLSVEQTFEPSFVRAA